MDVENNFFCKAGDKLRCLRTFEFVGHYKGDIIEVKESLLSYFNNALNPNLFTNKIFGNSYEKIND